MRRGHPINEGDKPELKAGETYYRHGLGCIIDGVYHNCLKEGDCPFEDDCHAQEKQMCTKNTVIARG